MVKCGIFRSELQTANVREFDKVSDETCQYQGSSQMGHFSRIFYSVWSEGSCNSLMETITAQQLTWNFIVNFHPKKINFAPLCFPLFQEGWLPQVPGRVCHWQQQKGGSREQPGGLQNCYWSSHVGVATHTPHPPRPCPQLLRLLLRDPQLAWPRLQVTIHALHFLYCFL